MQDPKARRLQLPLGVLRLAIQDITDQLSAEGPFCDEDTEALKEVASKLQQLVALSSPVNSTVMRERAHNETAGDNQNASAEPALPARASADDRSEGDPVPTLGDLSPWQSQLVEVFKEVDSDGSGKINSAELSKAMIAVKVPRARLAKLVHLADVDRSGEIDFDEWLRVIRGAGGSNELKEFSAHLHQIKSRTGNIYQTEVATPRFMLHPASGWRLSWDCIIIFLCSFIAICQPFIFAFEAELSSLALGRLTVIDRAIDAVFFIDIVLNFRTGYVNRSSDVHANDIVMDWKLVARRYAQTWLVVDVLSAIPFGELYPGSRSDLGLSKLLKASKLSKVVKLVAETPFLHLERYDAFEDVVRYPWLRFLWRRGGIVVAMVMLCHWMACIMKIVNEGFFQADEFPTWSQYTLALYWSMTTLTTVGYGDITPTSDGERIFTILAMVVGGAFYGIVIGSISSVVTQHDLNAYAFYERMDLIYAWAVHHNLPRHLRIGVCRFFRYQLASKSAISESSLWQDLSPELQKQIGAYIVHEDVRYNPMFDDIAFSAVVKLQSILHHFTVFAGSVITKSGDAGTNMFIITSGLVQIQSTGDSNCRTLQPGQSFGEEVLLGFHEQYAYDSQAIEETELEFISQDELLPLFQALPHVIERMRHNACEMNPGLRRRRPDLGTRENSVVSM